MSFKFSAKMSRLSKKKRIVFFGFFVLFCLFVCCCFFLLSFVVRSDLTCPTLTHEQMKAILRVLCCSKSCDVVRFSSQICFPFCGLSLLAVEWHWDLCWSLHRLTKHICFCWTINWDLCWFCWTSDMELCWFC